MGYFEANLMQTLIETLKMTNELRLNHYLLIIKKIS